MADKNFSQDKELVYNFFYFTQKFLSVFQQGQIRHLSKVCFDGNNSIGFIPFIFPYIFPANTSWSISLHPFQYVYICGERGERISVVTCFGRFARQEMNESRWNASEEELFLSAGLPIHEHWRRFPPPRPEVHYVVGTLLVLIGATGALGNALVLFVFTRSDKLLFAAVHVNIFFLFEHFIKSTI